MVCQTRWHVSGPGPKTAPAAFEFSLKVSPPLQSALAGVLVRSPLEIIKGCHQDNTLRGGGSGRAQGAPPSRKKGKEEWGESSNSTYTVQYTVNQTI
jgi:hypothetical protein